MGLFVQVLARELEDASVTVFDWGEGVYQQERCCSGGLDLYTLCPCGVFGSTSKHYVERPRRAMVAFLLFFAASRDVLYTLTAEFPRLLMSDPSQG